ncbi:hypothetical protein O988_09312 [Pseudogymnoascus sp. VKM F-3808]|nr:hypothetical protein O988_09312 [Pseudogymnoascus sp. VKM F-3808]
MDHDTLGGRCFQKGDHLGALEHFNKAIECSSSKLVPALLNKRSLVYIKLEKLQQALRDGREIIKRMPDRAMGYLRCGQVVQLMGQRDKAVEILERGLHKVPVGNDEDRKTLSKHYEALRRQSQAANRIDPLTRLPREIVQQIWGHLDLKACGRCLSVSKGWKKFVESYPPLWQNLKISNNNLSEAALTAWLKRAEHSGYYLRSAAISSNTFNLKCANNIKRIKRRPKLERLEFNISSGSTYFPELLPDPSQYLKTLIVSSGSCVDMPVVKQIMTDYINLEHVEFHAVAQRDTPGSWPKMPNLQIIVLMCDVRSSRAFRPGQQVLSWNGLIEASPNMKSASIHFGRYETVPGVVDMTSWAKLTFLNIMGTQFTSMPIFPSTLTHLEAERVKVGFGNFDPDQKDFFQLPNLKYLSINNSNLFTFVNDLANPALASGSLKELHVDGNSTATETHNRNSWVQTLPATSLKLRTLSLAEQTELPEKTIIELLRQYPNLQDINLSFTEATGSTLRELFERDSKPVNVDMAGCSGCHYDAVEAARGAGINVTHHLWQKEKVHKGRNRPST